MQLSQEAKEYKDKFDQFSVQEQRELILWFKEMQSEKYRKEYKEIEIHSYQGNITKEIKEAYPQFSVVHRISGNQPGIGTNVIVVPVDVYTEGLKKAAKQKFDDWFKEDYPNG